MIFRQFIYPPDGCASYLLGSVKTGEAVVVDPLLSLGVEEYAIEAADLGLVITHVIDTHIHADHLSAGRQLAKAAGAVYALSEQARKTARFDFKGLKDGDVIEHGEVELRVVETPGHTPESICLVAADRSRSDEPWFVLSGDTLMVGDVGRPDLLVGDQALDVYGDKERAELLYRSVRDRLFSLPEHTEVYPGHFGGSSCGGINLSAKPVTTIAFEKRFNKPLLLPDAGAFARFVTGTSKPHPPGFHRIKRLNLGMEEASLDVGA